MPHINLKLYRALFFSFHIGGFCPIQIVIGDTFKGWGFVVWFMWFHLSITGYKVSSEPTINISVSFEVSEVMKDE